MEVAHFFVKNLGPEIGKEKTGTFLSFPMTIAELDFSSAKRSIEQLCKYSFAGIGGRDATILDAMAQAGINKIMTHDQAFRKVEWADVVDPADDKGKRTREM